MMHNSVLTSLLTFLLLFEAAPPSPHQASASWPTAATADHRKHHRRRALFGFGGGKERGAGAESFQFTSQQYNLTIPENSIAGTIARSVTSRTALKMGVYVPKGYHHISFKIVEGDDNERFTATAKKLANFAFLVVELSGADAVLNRELQPQFQLLVRATAKRRKSHTLEASTTVNLTIGDTNDNAPMFSILDYAVRVDARTPQNSPVLRLEGFDADEGLNGALYFSPIVAPPLHYSGNASSPWSYFYVDSNSGWIRTFTPLLHPSNYTMEFLIEDRASRLSYHRNRRLREEQQSEEADAPMPLGFIRNLATVRIEVTALEMRADAWKPPTIELVPRDMDPFYGERGVFQTAATVHIPSDTNLPDNLHDLADITLELDRVVVAGTLSAPLAEYRVELPDGASNRGPQQILLRLERLNDTDFELGIAVFDDRNAATGTELPLFLLPQLDLRFSVREVDLSSGHYRHQRGALHSESVALKPNFRPRRVWFSQDATGELHVNESTPVGFVLRRFAAETSYPSADGARIRYRLEVTIGPKTNGAMPFAVDEHSGLLRVRERLPPAPSVFSVAVVAHLVDGASWQRSTPSTPPPNQRAIVNFTIVVADSNNNCPVFHDDSLPANFEVRLNSRNASEEPIFKPRVTDNDTGDNGRVLFKLLGWAELYDHFSIDEHSGEVRLIAALPETKERWSLKILAMDLGWPLSHQTQLSLDVIIGAGTNSTTRRSANVLSSCALPNLNTPAFEEDAARAHWSVNEDSPIGTIIGLVKATDIDIGYNGLVQYTLEEGRTGGANAFAIGLWSGELSVQSSLTALIQRHRAGLLRSKSNPLLVDVVELELHVVAQDSAMRAGERKSARRSIKVKVHGSNIHTPVFDKPNYHLTVAENSSHGVQLLTVQASDVDIGKNGRVEYALAADTATLLSVDPDSGVLRLDRPLDREQLSADGTRFVPPYRHALLMASDRGSPPKVAFANVTIEVADVNDNAPTCVHHPQKVHLWEDAPNGQLVTCLAATDSDAGDNALLNYSIVAGDGMEILRMDVRSGCLFLNISEPLSYEHKRVHSSTIEITDNGAPSLSTNCTLEVWLLNVDENQYPPQFSEVALEASVEENLPAGTEVVRVKAVDPEGTAVDYQLVGGSGLGIFTIDTVSGAVKTERELDYESAPYYWLTVRATDAGTTRLHSHLHLLVRVLGVNDHPPMFGQAMYYASVEENAPEGRSVLRVMASDRDAASTKGGSTASGVKYAITRGNPQSNFVIGEDDGQLMTGKRRLDRETQSEYELEVRACDAQGQPQLCSTAIVVVRVEEQNDNPPHFPLASADQKPTSVDVPAGRSGEALMRVIAYDPDERGPNSDIKYSLVDANSGFSIDQHGRIVATLPLKAGEKRDLRVKAADKGQPPRESELSLSLTAVAGPTKSASRVNKNKPRLLERDLWQELFVSDSDQVGTAVGVIKAIDDDGAPLWWHIDDSTNPNMTFSLQASATGQSGREATAELVLARPISWLDASLNTITLSFTVTDGVDVVRDNLKLRVSHSSSVMRPKFDHEAVAVELPSTSVPPGFLLYSPRAILDNDEVITLGISHPHRVVYALHAVSDTRFEEMVRVEPSTGGIVAVREFGRAALSKNFTVVVSAKVGGKEALAMVHFHRKPANDHSPRFLLSEQLITVEEGAHAEDVVGSVQAFDPDPGEDGTISYTLIDGNEAGMFSMNVENGEVRLNKSAAELPPSFSTTLIVRASDGAPRAPRSTTCAIRVVRSVVDAESTDRVEPLTTIHLSSTAGTALLPTVHFNLSSHHTAFPITYAFSGEDGGHCGPLSVHFVTGQLNRNSHRGLHPHALNCTIFASLEGRTVGRFPLLLEPIAAWHTQLRFTKPVYSSSIPENSPPGTLLALDDFAVVQAATIAEGESIRYRIQPTHGETHFAIDPKSGVLTSTAPLDFEAEKSWKLQLLAEVVGGSESRFTSQPSLVKINVTGVNDIAPLFPPPEQAYQFQLYTPPAIQRTTIGTVRAVDSDGTGPLRYSLRQGSKLFEIDSRSGVLSVATNDSNKALKAGAVHRLDVIATDGYHSVKRKIVVDVLNRSSLPLRFSRETYALSLLENTTGVGQHMLSLWPVDARPGENFRFRLLTPHPSFAIDERTGILAANPRDYPLDRERNPRIELLVEASSAQHNAIMQDRRAIATMNIDLEDVNDCAPVFAAATHFGTISTAARPGDRLLSLKAVDDDTGMNGVVRYKLAADAPPHFGVNKYDGHLSVAESPLSPDAFKLGEELSFHVIAEDLGTPQLSSRAKVTLRVVDKDQPTFSHLRYTAKVSEAAAPGTALVHVRAHSASNGVIHYRVVGGDSRRRFAIDSTTGQLSVNAELDRERQSNYTLAVEAVDVTRENVSSRCSVEVAVEDVNDTPPVFSRELYNFTVPETARLGTLLGRLEAFDPDIGENTLSYSYSYSILSGNKSVLSLDSATGSVYLAAQLDFETHPFYEFAVGCADQDRLASSALLHLHVTDANDNAPRIRHSGLPISHAVASNFSQQVLPLFVYQFGDDDVSDADTVSNLPDGRLFVYHIHRGDQTLFHINDASGLLTLVRPLDAVELEELTSASGLTRPLNISISDGLFTVYAPMQISLQPVGSVVRPLHFEKSSYRVPFAENRQPTNESAIVVVSAIGGHLPLQYHIAGDNYSASLVGVNPASGKVTLLRRVDAEERRLPALEIPLMVNDSDGRVAYSVLELVPVEENDNKPEWIAPRSGYSLCLSSGEPEAGPLATVLAVDADNGDRLEYSLVVDRGAEPSAWFDIHPTHGRLSSRNTSLELGRGTVRFSVRVTDSGNPPHKTDIPFEVKLLKVGSPIPSFSQLRYLFAVSEDYEVGKVIGRLQPSEQTIQGLQRVKFSIVSSSHGDTFDVETRSGDLVLKRRLDYEHQREHNFVAQIMNTEGAHTFCIVTISVMDVNDNAPKFTTHYDVLNVREDVVVGRVIAIYRARDADSDGPNSRLRYSLEHPTEAFTVDTDYGWLLVGKEGLDRERRATYQLRVCTTDEPGMSTCQNTTVNVLGVNDHPPEFEEALYQVEADSQTISMNSTLIGLRVMDRDSGSNMPRLFISSGNEDGAFGIVGKTTLVAKRTQVMSSRLLTVIAFDGANIGRTKVNVSYNAMSVPNITSCWAESETLTIAGNLSLGETIYALPAADSTGRAIFNHIVDYSQLPFKLLNNTNVTTSDGYHKQPDYKLRIRVRREFDEGARSCVHLLHIRVLNSNRMAPLLERREFSVALREDTVVPTGQTHFLMKLEARDDDIGDYGRLIYVIDTKGGMDGLRQIFEYFLLGEDTGVLSLRQQVDREKHSVFVIPVLVMDGGGLNTSAIIRVEVVDVNDNAPAFKESIYRLKVLENEAVGYRLLRVEAEDADANSTLTYQWGNDVLAVAKNLVGLNQRSGEITLVSSLDYEQLKELRLTVVATDSGEPPLSSTAVVEVEILDENDNPPRFQKSLYEGDVAESAEVGARILQVMAEDKDSEHFGKVSYSIVETADGNDANHFSISDDGWLLLAEPLDYENVKRIQLNVRALDGGSPALADEATVRIRVVDANDNAPEFAVCNMSAIIQEGVPPGQSLLTVSLTDADSIENGGPFRLELHGNGSTYFAFDPLYNLITTRQISFGDGKEYRLQVRAYDIGGKWSECPLTILVKQSSKHAPEVESLTVTLNTLMGEYLGGELGAVHANDKDPADTLHFGITTAATSAPTSNAKFIVDAESGIITAPGDLLPGLHRFNVSVTDGKYQVQAPVTVDVTSIDADAIDHSLSVQMRSTSPEKFLRSHLNKFQTAIADAVGVPATGVRLLSIQRSVEEPASTADLDVLLAVTRGESRGYHRPSFVKQRIESKLAEVEAGTGLQLVSLTSEVCRRDSCVHGECRDRLWFDNTPSGMRPAQADTIVFLAPRHLRSFECACRSGYSGRHCDVPVNRCSKISKLIVKELCIRFEMCVPADDEPTGFLCMCPPGTKGERCQESSCPDPNQCSIREELSVLGNGYFQLTISSSIEAKLDLALHFKTLGENGVLMHGHGTHDYHTIQIVGGHVEYRWECGSGEAVASIANERVDDGKWHHLRVSRRGRHSRIALDDTHRSEATSPSGSDVVNLYQHAIVLTFGAKVTQPALLQPVFHSQEHPIRQHHHREQASELQSLVEMGLVGCIGEIALDGYGLSKTEQGLYLHNAAIGCDASRMGPCLRVPCQHQGQCVPNRTANSYSCKCSARYTGSNCEIDLNACMSNPCPAGIPCHNLYNDFHCSCPAGFTGKRCNLRGDWDPCVTKPCGPYGICHQQGSSFTCTCSPGYRGDFCSERVADSVNSLLGLSVFEVCVMAALLVIVLLLTALILYVCRRHLRSHPSSSLQHSLKSNTQQNGDGRRRRRRERVPKGGGDAGNPLVVPRETPAPALGDTNDRPPPPLPPKFSKGPQGLLYTNLAHFRSSVPGAGASIGASGLPTVEVRPIQQQQQPQTPPVAPLHQGAHVAGATSCCHSPLLVSTGEAHECLHSHHQLPNSRPHHHRFSSRQNNGDGRNRGSQHSLHSHHHHHRYPSSSTENEASSDDVLRHFGQRIHRHRADEHVCGVKAACGSSTSVATPPADSSTRARNGGISDSIQCLRHHASEDHLRQADAGDKPSEYITMKPVHRANPFRVTSGVGGESRNKDRNNNKGNGQAGGHAPPLPLHRTPKLQQREEKDVEPSSSSTGALYDNPSNNDNGQAVEAFEDIDAD